MGRILYARVDGSNVLRKPTAPLCGRVVTRFPRYGLVTDNNMDNVRSVERLGGTKVPSIMFKGTVCRKEVSLVRLTR